jgi:hypothetical protein
MPRNLIGGQRRVSGSCIVNDRSDEIPGPVPSQQVTDCRCRTKEKPNANS